MVKSKNTTHPIIRGRASTARRPGPRAVRTADLAAVIGGNNHESGRRHS